MNTERASPLPQHRQIQLYKVGDWTCSSSTGFTGGSGQSIASLTVTSNTSVSVQFVPLNTLTLTELKIHGQNASTGSVTLPYTITQVAQSNINLEFDGHSGMSFAVTPALPLALTPGTPQNITIKVAASPGNYPAWEKTVRITRSKNNVATLQSFKLNGEAKTAPFTTEYTVDSGTATVTDFTFGAGSDGAIATVSPADNNIPTGTGKSFTITVTAQDDTVKQTIMFTVKRRTYNVAYSVDGGVGGTIQANSGSPITTNSSISVEYGGSVTFTATPTEGWEVDSWTGVTPASSSPDKTKATLSSVTNTTTVTVKFKKKQAIKVSDWEALRTAVKNASDGDVIEVTKDITYAGGSTQSTIEVKKNITIKSKSGTYTLNANGNGANNTAFNAKSTGIFEVTSGSLTLENVKLTKTEKYAVYVAEDSSLIMKKVTITNCKTRYNAAGIYFNKGKNLTLTRCTIDNCKGKGSDSSGGIDIQEPKESVTITDTTIQDCEATVNGGGITLKNNNNAQCKLENVTVQRCIATNGDGGGVCAKAGALTITGGSFKENLAVKGGGIFVDKGTSAQACTVTISGTSAKPVDIAKNEADHGGGLYNGGTANISYAKFEENTAKHNGGGIFISADAECTLGKDVKITENSATGTNSNGGGIFVDKVQSGPQAGKLTIKGIQGNPVVIAKNEADHGGGLYNGGTANISYAKFEENTAKHNGGGMYNAGTCTMDGVELKKNKADASDTSLRLGGGIFISADAECTLGKDVKITENSATGTNSNGGGIFVNKDSDTQLGTLTISGTQDNPVVIAKNEAAYGGGLYSYGTVTISYAEIKENKVPHNGGGMYNKGTCRMQHVTVKDNTASDPYSGGAGRGGGIYNEKTLTLTNTTVTGNTATLSGGALHLESNDSAFTMSGSTVITVDPSKNDVFLQERRFITIEDALTTTGNIARITPENYTVGEKVLEAPSTECAKFTVTPKDGNTWSIKSDGTLQQP